MANGLQRWDCDENNVDYVAYANAEEEKRLNWILSESKNGKSPRSQFYAHNATKIFSKQTRKIGRKILILVCFNL